MRESGGRPHVPSPPGQPPEPDPGLKCESKLTLREGQVASGIRSRTGLQVKGEGGKDSKGKHNSEGDHPAQTEHHCIHLLVFHIIPVDPVAERFLRQFP